MFFSLLIISLPIEGPAEIGVGLKILTTDKGVVLGILMLLFPGVIAFCMTASEFALLQRTSVVTLSICGIFKEVVTVIAAGIVFHDPLTPINVSGLLVTIVSIASYNYIKIRKMRKDAREGIVEERGRGRERETEGAEGIYTPVGTEDMDGVAVAEGSGGYGAPKADGRRRSE